MMYGPTFVSYKRPCAEPSQPTMPPPAVRVAAAAAANASRAALIEAIMNVVPGIDEQNVDGIAVEIKADAMTQAIAEGNDEVGNAYEAMQGIYFKVGELDGKPVYRQVPGLKDLFLWWSPGFPSQHGWYISERIWASDKQIDDVATFSWANGNPGDRRVGDKLHVPYWCKKVNNGVRLVNLHEYRDEIIQKLSDEIDELQKGGGGGVDDDGKGSSKGTSPPCTAGGEGGGGKGGGGWMNKAGKLAALIIRGKEDEALEMATSFSEHQICGTVVKRHTFICFIYYLLLFITN